MSTRVSRAHSGVQMWCLQLAQSEHRNAVAPGEKATKSTSLFRIPDCCYYPIPALNHQRARQMIGNLAIGVVLLITGLVLLFIGMPNKAGQSPRFLQFESSVVLYPPLIMALGAMGIAEIASAILGN